MNQLIKMKIITKAPKTTLTLTLFITLLFITTAFATRLNPTDDATGPKDIKPKGHHHSHDNDGGPGADFFGPGGGFGIPGFDQGWGQGITGGGYGYGYGSPSGGYSKGGVIRPSMVCKEKGPCYKKKLICPAKCFTSFSKSGKGYGGGGGGGGCTMDCKKNCVAYC